MKRTVVIAGGTGLIGRAVARKLAAGNFRVKILTRKPLVNSENEHVYWDPENGEIDVSEIEDTEFCINLAGANIAEKRWTKKRKTEILRSRVNSARLLFEVFGKRESNLKAYVASSAVGFYGAQTLEKTFSEKDAAGEDFLAKVCAAWEKESLRFQTKNIRTVVFRTGVVLAREGGAFPKLTQTLKFGFMNAVGNGKQILPWIHIDDISEMYLFAIRRESVSGVFNAVAPFPVTFDEFVTETLKIKKAVRFPNVPAGFVRMLFGEMSDILLNGSAVSSRKISDAGYQFEFPRISAALEDLLLSR